MKSLKLGAALFSGALLLTACGGDDSGGGSAEEGGGEVMDQVRLAIDGDDYMNQLAWMVADESYWPDLGFTEPAEVVASDEYLAGLFGGDVWVAQGESDVIWAALAEGSIPMKIIGVEKGEEAWFLGVAEGVDPENLEGLKISGGAAGDRNITVGEKMLEELGVDPEAMEWVSVEGGSDDRLVRPAGGSARRRRAPAAPHHPPGGRGRPDDLRGLQGGAPGGLGGHRGDHGEREGVGLRLPRGPHRRQAVDLRGRRLHREPGGGLAIASDRGLEPAEGDLEEWAIEMEHNWALDGGSSEEAFDAWNQDMIDNGNVPEGFDWREHVGLHLPHRGAGEPRPGGQPGHVRTWRKCTAPRPDRF